MDLGYKRTENWVCNLSIDMYRYMYLGKNTGLHEEKGKVRV